MTKIAAKKMEPMFSIFLAVIFVTKSPPRPPLAIVSLFNIFENFKFSKMLDEAEISRIRGSCNCEWGGGKEWVMKIETKKNRRLHSQSAFLSCLPPFSRTG